MASSKMHLISVPLIEKCTRCSLSANTPFLSITSNNQGVAMTQKSNAVPARATNPATGEVVVADSTSALARLINVKYENLRAAKSQGRNRVGGWVVKWD